MCQEDLFILSTDVLTLSFFFLWVDSQFVHNFAALSSALSQEYAQSRAVTWNVSLLKLWSNFLQCVC